MHLIVGLGNPGVEYAYTRHNLGYLTATAFAERRGVSLKSGWRVKGKVATAVYNGKKVVVLLPTTYMNLSGGAVKRLVDYYKVPLEQVMVVVDDVYLSFGRLRMRKRGSSGGHNGLRSIEEKLQTQDYPRLKMGIAPKEGFVESEERLLHDFVLESFDKDERALLPDYTERGVMLLETWLDEGIDGAIHKAGECRPLSG